MSGRPDFAAVQAHLAAYLRDPDGAPAPADVDPQRVAVYARLVYNNLDTLLAGCFPVLKRVLDDASWRSLVRGFLAGHRAHTPLFPQLPQAFVTYLTDERGGHDDPPWLAELADYEWLELECGQDPREIDELVAIDTGADLLEDLPVLNPLARPRAYAHAVHTIAPGRVPDGPAGEPVWIVVFRTRADRVAYLQLNAVTARLVELMARHADRSGRALLLQVAEELSHPRPTKLVEAGRVVLEELLARELVLGARR